MFSGLQMNTEFTIVPLNLRLSQFFCSYFTKLLENSFYTAYMKASGQLSVIISMMACEILLSLCSTMGKGKSGHFRERNWRKMEKSLVRDNLLDDFKLQRNYCANWRIVFSMVLFINM